MSLCRSLNFSAPQALSSFPGVRSHLLREFVWSGRVHDICSCIVTLLYMSCFMALTAQLNLGVALVGASLSNGRCMAELQQHQPRLQNWMGRQQERAVANAMAKPPSKRTSGAIPRPRILASLSL